MVLRIAIVDGNSVILVMKGGSIVLGVLVPLSVEEYLVGNHISQHDASSLLATAPPGSIAVETLLVLVIKNLWFVDVLTQSLSSIRITGTS